MNIVEDKSKDLIIDETNFDQYFFDVRKNKPKPGQVLACYEAEADFVEGNLKKDIVHLLMTNNKGSDLSVRLMQKLAGATKDSAISVVKEMMSDLLSGVSSSDVAKKNYSFHCQYFFYTDRDYIPQNDPHWWSTSLIDISRPSDEDIDLVLEENSKN